MQAVKTIIMIILLSTLVKAKIFSQTFETVEKAKKYFYDLDDSFNIAMATKDSAFFNNVFADAFINETPYGNLNTKAEEVKGLVGLAPKNVVRVAPKFDIFTYSCEVATLSVVKKLTMKDSTILYVRRTIVHKLIEGKWKIVSGQGTVVQPKVVE